MELSRQIRTLALGAALACSVVGMPALHAFAAAPTGGGPYHGRLTPVVRPDLPVQGGSTGQGPATDEGCQAVASSINDKLGAANQELNTNGMTDTWNNLVDSAKAMQDEAMDQGCFFVNPA